MINAKAQVDTFNNQDIVGCDLVAGAATDSTFVQGVDGEHASQVSPTAPWRRSRPEA